MVFIKKKKIQLRFNIASKKEKSAAAAVVNYERLQKKKPTRYCNGLPSSKHDRLLIGVVFLQLGRIFRRPN